MIKYQIRSRELLDVANDLKSGRLVLSPYFQRDLVWRELHMVEFIKTILLGLPFPQIFISRGKIDIDTMTSRSSVVDGQQRLNSILRYLGDELVIDGKKYSDLSAEEKESFLTYEIPIIDLDLAESDPLIVELFKRLNRTFYSLSKIERMATEFAPSEYMFVAKILAGQIDPVEEAKLEPPEADPNVPSILYEWAKKKRLRSFHSWLLNSGMFTQYEISRKVHLMFVLNLMSTAIGGFYNRNELAETFLEEKAESFDGKDDIVSTFNETAALHLKLKINKTSYWNNKSNAFSLFLVLVKLKDEIDDAVISRIRDALAEFEGDRPEEYELAARESVNNKPQRQLRDDYLMALVADAIHEAA